MGERRRKQYDRLRTGILTGLLLPLTVFILLYLIRYSSVPFFTYLSHLQDMKILVRLLSLCGFVNLLVFLIFYRAGMDKAARGVVAATLVYALAVLVSTLF